MELSDSSSSSHSSRTKQQQDNAWKPGANQRNLRLCVQCRLYCRLKICKVCKRSCHLKCGRSDPGVTDFVLSPNGPAVTCFDCVAEETTQAAIAETPVIVSEYPPLQGPFTAPDLPDLNVSDIVSLIEEREESALQQSAETEEDITEPAQAQAQIVVEAALSVVELTAPAVGELPAPAVVEPAGPSHSTPRRRELSPLSQARLEVPQRRSSRLASNLMTMLPPDDSDGSLDGSIHSSWNGSDDDESEEDETTEQAVPAPVPVPKHGTKAKKKSTATATQTPVNINWPGIDLPRDQVVNMDLDQSSGIRLRIPLTNASRMTPVEYFFKFFDEEVIAYIVEQSVLYHRQRKLKCPEMSSSHLCKFLGFILYAGCIPLPGKDFYWQAKTRQSVVADNFSKNEMRMVKAQLHFADNTNPPTQRQSSDTFWKIEPLVNILNNRFQALVIEENSVAIDEQMTIYTGSKAPVGLKQYLPSKPVPHGFKNWARGGISGYIYEMTFYTGKTNTISVERRSARIEDAQVDTQTDAVAQPEVTLKTAQVVLNLTRNCQPGSFVYFDNLFATTVLLKALIARQLHFVCTFRATRLKDCPLTQQKLFEKQPRGAREVFFNVEDKFVVVAWNDTKRVVVASDFVGAEPTREVRRWSKKERKYIDVDQPAIIQTYNTFMGGVDLADMLAAMHASPFRWGKWFMRIFCRMLDTALANAWLVYRSQVIHFSYIIYLLQIKSILWQRFISNPIVKDICFMF